MKGKSKKVLAGFLAVLMVLSLLPVGLFTGVLEAKAAETASGGNASTTYTFDATTLTATADKEKIAAGTTYADGYIKTFGDVQMRTASDGSVSSTEVGKDGASGYEFTVTGSADVSVVFSSTGGSNTSTVGIWDSTGALVANNEGITEVTGSASGKKTLTYTLPAGTYRVVSPDATTHNRGARVYSIEITDIPLTTTKNYSFDATTLTATADKEKIAAGTTYADGYIKTFGDVQMRTASDGSVSSTEVGKDGASGYEFTVTGSADVSVVFSSTGGSNTSTVGIWDSTGALVANNEGITEVTGSASGKKTLTYTLPAGTYRVVSPDATTHNRGARVYSIDITETTGGERPARADWSSVAVPAITDASVSDGEIKVSFDMVIGYDGADSVDVNMLDENGNVIDTKSYSSSGSSASVVFAPDATGVYTFIVIAKRADETNKTSETSSPVSYSLPLATPSISSATSIGGGSVSVVWAAVPEAESYEVYVDETLAGTTKELKYVVSDLAIGTKYAFTVVAVRGTDRSEASKAAETTATAEAQNVWGFTVYGSSTDSSNNGYEGSANDGSVTVYSLGGKGKIVPASTDGIAFYYTTVPTEYNFTLKANVHIDSWTLSNGQEGFGLLATDRVVDAGQTNPVWNNQYMALASKIEYYWNSSEGKVDVSGRKYTMKMGLGVIEKSGVTQENLPKLEANDTATVNNEFSSVTTTLDTEAAIRDLEAGTYNIVGNATAAVEGTIAELQDFVLEIQKNNTGYFITYYDQEGNVIAKQKYYEPDALSHIDAENVYVGFFASRNAKATFSNIQFSTILASEDAPAEERPVTTIAPTLNILSAKVANTNDYTFSMVSNVDGTARVVVNGEVVAEGLKLEADVRCDLATTLVNGSSNSFYVEFFPDPDQELPPYTVLENTDKIEASMDVNRSASFDGRVNLYVSPNGSSYGTGSENSPIDIYSAVSYAQPGQTIVLMEGTYTLDSTVRIERGIDGTADNYIRMVADPKASSRPVFDFQGLCAGMIFGGNYWYFNGFDCTNSQNAQKGIQVSGSYNILDNVNAYHNGNTGIQISRLYGTDLYADWPSHNLILNCTSYGNADAGYEDADGFAAKLTVGDGNVFDGCVAYNNADDGWDLFAKVETGSIGSVTIQNCVAYGNGYLEDGTNAGNGNGFKMGGDSLSGYHKLINSYAFFNKAKGIDSNSCPDIQVENSISYNNESYNVAFYTNNAKNTDFAATGIVSFKDANVKSGLGTGEQFKPVGTQDKTKYTNDTNYYWDGTKSSNGTKEVTADWFKTLEFTGVTRNADGTINLNGFLELTDAAPEGVGADTSGTGSQDVTLNIETAVDPEESSGSAAGEGVASSTETVVSETTNADNYIPTSVFTDLINTGKTLVVNVTDDNGKTVATYTIDGTKFTTAPASDFALKVHENVINGGISDVVRDTLGVTSDKADIITFEHSGVLNGNLKVKVVLTEGKFAVGTELKLFYFNELTRQLEDQNQTVVVAGDNTAEFVVTHCSSYVLVPTGSIVTPEVPTQPTTTTPAEGTGAADTADTTPLALLMVIAVLSGAAFIVVSKKRIME